MPNTDAMFEAHVQFELSRWSGDQLSSTLAEEIAILFGWLDTVPLSAVISRESVDGWVREHVCEAPISPELIEIITGIVHSLHSAATEDGTPVDELLPRSVYDQFATTVIGMTEVRVAVMNQVTTSEVYSRLISHVLYHGIKNYLLTESVIARKVPGASSLMRLGQSALNTAAPKLEKSIDRQLTSFVNSNIQDSIRESRHYLNTVLDEELLSAVADEVWNDNAASTIADAASVVSSESLDGFAEAGLAAWLHVRATPTFQEMISQVVDEFLQQQGDRPLGDLLAGAGVTPEAVSSLFAEATSPAVAWAVEDGYLETRIRARLGEFYLSYNGATKRAG